MEWILIGTGGALTLLSVAVLLVLAATGHADPRRAKVRFDR